MANANTAMATINHTSSRGLSFDLSGGMVCGATGALTGAGVTRTAPTEEVDSGPAVGGPAVAGRAQSAPH